MSQSPHFAIAEAAEREEARAREENEAVRVASSSSREEDVEVDVGDTTAAAAAEGTLVVEEVNFPSSTTMVVFDFKRNNKSWQIYLGGIATRRDYEHRVDDFCVYHKPPNALPDSLIDYFYERQQETKMVKKVEKCRYAATTMISWFSMFKKFFDYCHDIDIEKECKILPIALKNWSKLQKVTKSKVFTKADISESILIYCYNIQYSI
jgi:hypothetical protein